MARVLSQTLIGSSSTLIYGRSPALGLSPRILLAQRHRSNRSGKARLIEVDLESNGDVEVLDIRKLEDVIHSIIVKRSAPDWLPFIPGSSYWVPPRRRPYGVIANPLTVEESMSLTTLRGWPSSVFFIQGSSPAYPVPVEVKKVHNDFEDEEG